MEFVRKGLERTLALLFMIGSHARGRCSLLHRIGEALHFPDGASKFLAQRDRTSIASHVGELLSVKSNYFLLGERLGAILLSDELVLQEFLLDRRKIIALLSHSSRDSHPGDVLGHHALQ